MKNELLHGTVAAVQNGILSVLINNKSVCAGCKVQRSCDIAGAQEKRIQIPDISGNYKEGDTICLSVKKSMGLTAVFFAFILPLTLMLVVLFIISFAGKGEVFMALAALFAVLTYYISLYFFRDKLKQKFTFIIQ